MARSPRRFRLAEAGRGARAADRLQQELQDLEVPARLGQVAAPRVEAVPPDQEPVRRAGRRGQQRLQPRGLGAASPGCSRRWAATRGGRGWSRPPGPSASRSPRWRGRRRPRAPRRGAWPRASACGPRPGRRARGRPPGGSASRPKGLGLPSIGVPRLVDLEDLVRGASPPLSTPLAVTARRSGSSVSDRAEVAAGPEPSRARAPGGSALPGRRRRRRNRRCAACAHCRAPARKSNTPLPRSRHAEARHRLSSGGRRRTPSG